MSGTQPRGLDSATAAARLAAEGYNELPRSSRRGLRRIVVEVLREPMFQLLLAAGAIYLLLGDLREALLLLLFALGSVAITIVQESRTERALEALRDLGSPRALVIRDGVMQRVPGREVVRGDCVRLVEGDRLPADLRLLEACDLQADESMLTGESVPVRKAVAIGEPPPSQAGGDDLPWAFSGTLIVRGDGLGEVVATGPRSELGKIGQLLGSLREPPTALHQQTRRLVRAVAAAGFVVSTLVAVLYGLLREAWLDGLLAGVALAMSLLPEEFPLVLSVFLALGARRIARHRVLTRRCSAIEALGAATILCTDKTGTLTLNRMTVAELCIGAESAVIDGPGCPPRFAGLLRAGALASKPAPVDPMDKALRALDPAASGDAQPVREYGLTPALPAMSLVWRDGAGFRVAAKGAPEAIAELCGFDAAALAALRTQVDAMAARGLRVLGVAEARWPAEPFPESQRGFPFAMLGLVGFADPLRPSVPEAIRLCRAAGIRVAMITGDYPATASAIARAAGIDGGEVLSGKALAQLDDAALRAAVRRVNVYARVAPAQKLRIVEALKADGEVVAMTGDGVNDAPSLKAAHIGVAMGGRGTDVAREASALILLDDDFGALVTAVREGRRIHDNLRKAMSYILAAHVPIAGLALLPLLFGWPLILLPLHIVVLEMVIDPACSIVFEAEAGEPDLMRRPPRAPDANILSRGVVAWSLLQGAAVLALLVLLSLVGARAGLPVEDLRALLFAALVTTNLGLIFVNRSFGSSLRVALRQPNAMLWRMLLATAAALALMLYLPALRGSFHFGLLHGDDLGLALSLGVALLAALEWAKRRLARRLGLAA